MAKSKSDKNVGLVYNRATGKFQKPATAFDSTNWWSEALGFGGRKPGKGALAKRRKEAIDSNVEAAGG